VILPAGTNAVWETVVAKPGGEFEHPAVRGGYVSVPFVSDRERILLLQAAGHQMVYVNGVPRAGDIYRNGSVSPPVVMRKGTNELLFATGRGALNVRLAEPTEPVALDPRDPTLPDLVLGQRNDTVGAVIVVNATEKPVEGLTLRATVAGGGTTDNRVPTLPAFGVHKTPFRIVHSGRSRTNRLDLALELRDGRTRLATRTFPLSALPKESTRRETFVSGIDGSVQYYGFVPARPLDGDTAAPGLVISAHGAGVEGAGQAACYVPKASLHIAAPTNRRPFGFDWEDWGRRDAIEVLDRVQNLYRTDRSRTYLTGHSMGGHGTWQMGGTLPDRFAALAPSAGWISWGTYGGGRRPSPTNDVQRLIQRASMPVDTFVLATNYLQHGIYILHGDADDNVPVAQARTMRELLGTFHHDFAWHEVPGAGHWFGNQSVDWPAIFDLFARHRIPGPTEVRRLRFTTANPGISAKCQWASIEAQIHPLAPSWIDLEWDSSSRRVTGSTENVARLALHLNLLERGSIPTLTLDGQTLTNLQSTEPSSPGTPPRAVWLTRQGDRWSPAGPASVAEKGPHRAGPFKEAFGHRILLVYGTRGDCRGECLGRGQGPVRLGELLVPGQCESGDDPRHRLRSRTASESRGDPVWQRGQQRRLEGAARGQPGPGTTRIGPSGRSGDIGDGSLLPLRPAASGQRCRLRRSGVGYGPCGDAAVGSGPLFHGRSGPAGCDGVRTGHPGAGLGSGPGRGLLRQRLDRGER